MLTYLKNLFGKTDPGPTAPSDIAPVLLRDEDVSASGYGRLAPSVDSYYDGEKFPGGFGLTQLYEMDYWTLRERSSQLFTENLYARGLLRRLITNEVNKGLTPEVAPIEKIIGVPEDSLVEWADEVESRFLIWAKDPLLCDFSRAKTFGKIQQAARLESLISGDVLITVRHTEEGRPPKVKLISGDAVKSPVKDKPRNGNTIEHGVELDSKRRQVAYWVEEDDGKMKRLPAYGEKTGRKLAWLIYGCEKRLDEVRGLPMLSLILQSLKEIDRYRDSATRKAVVNSFFAAVVTKDKDKPGSLPVQGGAVKKGQAETSDYQGGTRKLNVAKMLPGTVIEELQAGEDISFKGGDGTDVNFAPFEMAIMQGIAWGNEIPPEILTLSFSSNYSASMAALNEFRMYLDMRWALFGDDFCQPIYQEWLISEVMRRRIDAPGLLEAWRDRTQYDVFGAWMLTFWYGSIKPTTDPVKQVKASEAYIAMGLSTYAREARINTGTKFDNNVKKQRAERQKIRELDEISNPVVEEAPEEPSEEATAFEDSINELYDDMGLDDDEL